MSQTTCQLSLTSTRALGACTMTHATPCMLQSHGPEPGMQASMHAWPARQGLTVCRYASTAMYASNTKSVQEAQAELAKERQQAEKALVNMHAQARGVCVQLTELKSARLARASPPCCHGAAAAAAAPKADGLDTGLAEGVGPFFAPPIWEPDVQLR